MNVIKLYFFEHVDNNHGRYSREWFDTAEAATKARDAMLNDGWHREPDEEEGGLTGEYGQVGPVDDVLVEMSTAGIVRFANGYATGDTE